MVVYKEMHWCGMRPVHKALFLMEELSGQKEKFAGDMFSLPSVPYSSLL